MPSLRPDFTFARFVKIGASSSARRLAIAVATHRGKSAARVVFLHGPTGVGKTHLLHAIAHRTTGTVRILETAILVADLVAAVRADEMPAFFDRQAAADLLLLEDIDVLVDRPGTQAAIGALECVSELPAAVRSAGL